MKNAQLIMNYEEFISVLTEVEAVINLRPLTYLYSDNVNQALTPAHLIYGKKISNFTRQYCLPTGGEGYTRITKETDEISNNFAE